MPVHPDLRRRRRTSAATACQQENHGPEGEPSTHNRALMCQRTIPMANSKPVREAQTPRMPRAGARPFRQTTSGESLPGGHNPGPRIPRPCPHEKEDGKPEALHPWFPVVARGLQQACQRAKRKQQPYGRNPAASWHRGTPRPAPWLPTCKPSCAGLRAGGLPEGAIPSSGHRRPCGGRSVETRHETTEPAFALNPHHPPWQHSKSECSVNPGFASRAGRSPALRRTKPIESKLRANLGPDPEPANLPTKTARPTLTPQHFVFSVRANSRMRRQFHAPGEISATGAAFDFPGGIA